MPGYLTRQDPIAIRGAADLIVHALRDRQQYADPLGDAQALGISAATWPLFGVAWPAGLQLAAHMAARPLRAGERVLEVGCGLGLASLVCHRRGIDVTASDNHPLAGDFLARNAGLNGLAPLPYRHGDWAGGDADLPAGTAERVSGAYDLVIGSDVLYERDDGGHLASFIERHVGAVAEVLIVDPDRGNRPAFTRRMNDRGYVLRETRLRTPEADGLPFKGRLLHYRRGDLGASA